MPPEVERFSKTCPSSSRVSPKTKFHLVSNLSSTCCVEPKDFFPYGHKMATSNYWGIYASSPMFTGRSTMLHNSRVHHSWNRINHNAKGTYKVPSKQFWWKSGAGFYIIKQFSDTTWVPYNSTNFWYCLSRDSIRFHQLRAQSHKPAPPPPQMPSANLGYHLLFWQATYRSEV